MFVVTAIIALLLGLVAGGVGVLLAKVVPRFEDSKAKRVHGIVLAVTIGFIVSFAPALAKSSLGDALATTLGVKLRSEVVVTRAMRPFIEDPRLQAQLEGKDDAFTRAHVASLPARGVTLLPAAELERWRALRLRLAEASPEFCAGGWRGGLAPRDLFRALDALTEEEQEGWGALVTRAGKLALDTPTLCAAGHRRG
jgi:hypothetical protein